MGRLGMLVMAAVLAAAPARAQVSSGDAACIRAFNQAVADVAKAQGKAVSRCLKMFASGALTVPPESCMLADPTGRLARAAAKAVTKVDVACAGGLPDFGVSVLDEAVGHAAVGEIRLLRGAIGPSLDTGLVPRADEADCQARAGATLLACADARRKAFTKCQKSGLSQGSITSAGSLADVCLGVGESTQPDPGGKLAARCAFKLGQTVAQHCAGVDLAEVFPTCDTTSAATLASCLDGESGCQLCQLLNEVDGLARDCDAFDDGDAANGTCGAECADGVVQVEEGCDDGGTADGDGCSATCAVEPGFACTGSPSVCTRTCGNGAIDPGETCDDGDDDGGDGCSASCRVETGYTCTGVPSMCTPRCGNGVLNPSDGEVCDDGDHDGGDGCSATCAVEPGWVCSGQPSVCTFVCGNGTFQAGESCDDGDATAGDGCSAVCQIEPGWLCSGQPSLCVPLCGDGLVRGGETCDDGNLQAGDGCSFTCQTELGFTCPGTPSNCIPICGDGRVRGSENCDDGDTAGGDGCSGLFCRQEPGWTCAGQPSVCIFDCGNGQLDAGEECDDGNLAGGDGCGPTCRGEPGFACGGEPSVCVFSCGNGAVDGGETCDDGNAVSLDGCSASCRNESGWLCTSPGTPCSPFDIEIDTPAHGVFTTAGTQLVTGRYTTLPPGLTSVRINGVPAASVNTTNRTFAHTITLDPGAVFNPVRATLTNLGNGDDSHDRIVVIAGDSVADGAHAPQSVALRMNDRGIDAIEPLMGDLAAGEFDLGELVPTDTVLLPWQCYFQFIWCWAGAEARIGSPPPSFGDVRVTADSKTGAVAADITLEDLRIDIHIDGTGLVPDCGLRLQANELRLSGDYTLEPDDGDPSFVDVDLTNLTGVTFSGFSRQFTYGSCGLVESQLGDVEALARDAITGFIDDPDGPGPEDSPLAEAIENALAGISISGAVGSGLGLDLDAPLFTVSEDPSGITFGAHSRFSVDVGSGPGQCLPPPGAPDLTASYAPPVPFPAFGATAPVSGAPYGVGIGVSPAGFNQLLRGQTECGLLRTSLSDIDLDGPGGNAPIPITSSLLSLLAPEFAQLPPNTPLRIDVAPTLAPVITGAPGPSGELEELRIAHVAVSIVEPGPETVWLGGAFDARLGMDLGFLPDGSGLSVTLAEPAAADTTMTITHNPLGADEAQLETLLPSVIRPLIPDLAGGLSGFPLPEFFGLVLGGVEVSHQGDFTALYADLTPVP
jgi:cysteine-rich repeat protein